MDRFVLKEKLPLRTVVMVLLGLSGVLVILLDDILFSEEAVGQTEQDQARNTTLGNFICLLNPVSWSFYWMIVRRAQKQRDTVAANKSLDASKDTAAPQDEEHWWDEMLAIQIVAAGLTALFSCIGMMASGWSEQVATVQGSDVPIYIVFGMYIPFVLLMFSLAPRYIATAEMGCIKMLGAFAYASHVGNAARPNRCSLADRSCLCLVLYASDLSCLYPDRNNHWASVGLVVRWRDTEWCSLRWWHNHHHGSHWTFDSDDASGR